MSLQRRRPSRAVAGWQHGTNTAVLMAGAAYGAVMAAGVIARSERGLHLRRNFVAASWLVAWPPFAMQVGASGKTL
ncbi:hypothetical protein [Ectopseudomonas khazarica]|uniref:hypothetical protein n=1 Tax=Ectopseudomonas khazarica TaxID=2502979 RepID=UPI00370A455D